MPVKLDYAPPPEEQPETNPDRVLRVVLIIGILIMLLTSILLDGGKMFALWGCLIGPVLIGLATIATARAGTGRPRLTPLRLAGYIVGVCCLVIGILSV